MSLLTESRTETDSEPNPKQAGDELRPSGRRFALTPVTALGAIAVVAAIAALVFGVLWAVSANDAGLELAEQREVVQMDARQAAINLNTLDHKNVQAGLDLWEQTSTGTLLDEFRTNRAEYEKLMQESRRATVATVLDSAVSELDVRSGQATVIAAVDVEVRPEGQEPVVTRQRIELEMTRTDQGWKASRVAPVRNPG